MLRQIDVRGFKGVVDDRLELGRLNVIVGPSGSGKTTWLEAAAMLGCAAGGRVDPGSLATRGLRRCSSPLYRTALDSEDREPRPITLEARSEGAFYRASLEAPAEDFELRWTFIEERLEEGSVVVGSRDRRGGTMRQPGDAEITLSALRSDEGIAPSVKQLRSSGSVATLVREIDSFAIYTPAAAVLSGVVEDPSHTRPMGLLGGRLDEMIYGKRPTSAAAAFRRRINDELRKVKGWQNKVTIKPSPARKAAADGRPPRGALSYLDGYLRADAARLSESEVSEGANQAATLLTFLFHPSMPPFVAIDNFDHALNPKLSCYLLSRMQEIVLADPSRPQLLLTSRHPNALEALDLTDDRVRLHVASRDRNTGALRLHRIERSHVEGGLHGPELLGSRVWLTGDQRGI